jgi:cytochrome bd-type quinol oxidase subunit 1
MHPQNFSILNAESCKEITKNENVLIQVSMILLSYVILIIAGCFVLLSKWEEKLAHLERTCTV